jgi:hypothetical protein
MSSSRHASGVQSETYGTASPIPVQAIDPLREFRRVASRIEPIPSGPESAPAYRRGSPDDGSPNFIASTVTGGALYSPISA